MDEMDFRTLADHIQTRTYKDDDDDCHRWTREVQHPITKEWDILTPSALDVDFYFREDLLKWLRHNCLVLDPATKTWSVAQVKMTGMEF